MIADGINDLGIDNTSATSCGAPNFLGNSLTGCPGSKGCFSPFLGRLLLVDATPGCSAPLVLEGHRNDDVASPDGEPKVVGLSEQGV